MLSVGNIGLVPVGSSLKYLKQNVRVPISCLRVRADLDGTTLQHSYNTPISGPHVQFVSLVLVCYCLIF